MSKPFFRDFVGEAQSAMSASARERTVGGSFCEILPSQKLPKKGDRTITFSENSRDQRMVPVFAIPVMPIITLVIIQSLPLQIRSSGVVADRPHNASDMPAEVAPACNA
jgi:hypothetical protein